MSVLSDWRTSVIDACTDAYPTLGGRTVTGYPYPHLHPQAPAVIFTPASSGEYVNNVDTNWCAAGFPQGRLLWLVSQKWEEAAFDAVDEVASTIAIEAIKSRVFTVSLIGTPGIVGDLSDSGALFLGLPVEIVGLAPVPH